MYFCGLLVYSYLVYFSIIRASKKTCGIYNIRCMATVNETKWLAKYLLLKEYVEQHHQLPDKKKVENRGLLNWWKYNKKLAKQGKLSEEKLRMLHDLSDSRIIKSDKKSLFL